MSGILVQLKAGDERQPLFLAHGMGGSVGEFLDLVKYLHTGRAIYGLQARGNDGLEEPFKRIEDLAEYFLNALENVQPRGPYSLIGYSLGGLVALEMAQRLASQGQTILLLAMLESYPHPGQLALGQRIRLALRGAKRHISAAMNPPARFNQYSKSSDYGSRDQIRSAFQSRSEIMRRAYDSAYRAWRLYRPRSYQGKIYFVRAAISTIYPDDPVAVWGKLAHKLEVQNVPGDHHGILAEHCEILGSLLSEFLRRQIP